MPPCAWRLCLALFRRAFFFAFPQPNDPAYLLNYLVGFMEGRWRRMSVRWNRAL